MVTIIDPPSGWLYKFPKEFTFKPSSESLSADEYQKEVEQWFRDNGYPQKLINQGMLKYCRSWVYDG